ncbi:type I-E CRISPR-associated protein Cse2/CasB [Streptomyces microflavus]|uniref:type I-E CRISPR-associated protein Cse2/CasB n=1 Tax=Streptomyces microflavus TaxID=1919 RepID=UPI0038213F1E
MALKPVLHVTFPPPRPASREAAAANLVRRLFDLMDRGELRTLSLLREGAPAAPSDLPWGPITPEEARPYRGPRPPLMPRMPFRWSRRYAPNAWGPGMVVTYPEWFAYREQDAEAFRAVAQLFAIYHRDPRTRHRRGKAGASLGTAMRPLKADGPHDLDPGIGGRLLGGLIRRQQLPLRELRQVCVTLRAHELPPPNWPRLALDLGDWGTRLPRKHGPGGPYGPRTVAELWVQDFYRAGRDFA